LAVFLQDKEIRVRRQACEQEAGPHLLPHERENIVLACVSQNCYQRIYGIDPLEEGEIDTMRGREYRSCTREELQESRRAATGSDASSAADKV